MKLDDALRKVAVIGAAGKMGSGISLLLLQEIARTEAEKTGEAGSGEYTLTLIDANEQALFSLRRYLRAQLTKYAEKNINSLREYYAANHDLISNEEILRAFVDGALDCTRFETELTSAKDSIFVFEAILEDVASKITTFSNLKAMSRKDQYYLTNTSSIPISLLNETCHLDNRIIGYHFYNPPAIQKVLEVVETANVEPQLHAMAIELAKRLHKVVVRSHDIPGFIGNGLLIPEIIFACNQARALAKEHSLPLSQAITLINQVTQEYLLRPMGVFQLMDYVGIDVCQNIAKIMSIYLPDATLKDELIDALLAAGIKGGQHGDGSQKDGVFQYKQQSISGVYDLKEKKYLTLFPGAQSILGELPQKPLTWKDLQNDSDKINKIKKYFDLIFQQNTLGAALAKASLKHSRQIARNLIEAGVADRLEDVDTVLKNGFFHVYGVADLRLPAIE